jgi:hypothetical protein
MKLLVSVCKKTEEYPITSGILEIDLDTQKIEYLKFQSLPPYLQTCNFDPDPQVAKTGNGRFNYTNIPNTTSGLAWYRGNPIVVFRGTMPPSFVSFSKNGILDAWLTESPDPHSITTVGNHLYVATSSLNGLQAIHLDGVVKAPYKIRPEVWHREDEADHDVIHLNSVIYHRGSFYISAFGKKSDQFWSTATNGYVKNISTGEKVADVIHPHTLVSSPDDLYFCESSKSAVRNLTGEMLVLPEPGYTRGLAFHKQHMFIGVSEGRRQSKSTGLVNNPVAPGLITGVCSIYVYQRQNKLEHSILKSVIDLSRFAHEVFDILVVE